MFSRSYLASVHCVLPALALIVCSCSVKEDRTECPCFLTLDLGGVGYVSMQEKGLAELGIYLTGGDGYVLEDSFPLRDNVLEYGAAVPKGEVELCVSSVGNGCEVSAEYGLTIPEGSQCPVVYMYADRFEAAGNTVRKAVLMHKNWCQIDLRMKSTANGSLRPFWVSVDGNINGYRTDGTPKEGPFRYSSERSAGGLCKVRVPQQIDDSLWLQLHFLDSDEIRGFPLGEYILSSGYDWTAPDLDDVQVQMDFSKSGVTFTISSWHRTMNFEMVI